MRTSLVLLVSVVASATAMPLRDTLNAGLFPRNKDVLPASTKTEPVTAKDATNQPTKKQSEKTDGGTKDWRTTPLTSIPSQDDRADTEQDAAQKQPNEGKEKTAKKNRKHKAIFVNYPIVSELQYSDVPYDIDYSDNSFDTDERSAADANRYQESNIFYIRLPPTPYMFVPGLGYISNPPTYSTSNLHPQIPFTRPARPKPVYRQPVNPFIKLPIDFVSNGKPTSVYQWQKKPAKKPSDTPITNLDSLSAEFVSNGKPTSIYQWQSNAKPINRPDDFVHNMDKGPYSFNGKPTSFFLLKSDGTSSAQQSLRYSDYQQDNSYY
ncbi:uncharacterized protein LOC128891874 [Hylaeus anthracinus]|uniref:uncharacterized protein LOC128891874 n=1 Tax=Hylaeus anthracinus TaxID=313031 RepID=UPI0023B9BB63|nr:uncharacterized protein LOC128891874 [Hylaeus anthracinus]